MPLLWQSVKKSLLYYSMLKPFCSTLMLITVNCTACKLMFLNERRKVHYYSKLYCLQTKVPIQEKKSTNLYSSPLSICRYSSSLYR